MTRKNFELTYPRDLYLAWKRGRLHYRWFRQYRNTFDEDDLRIVRNQHSNGNHFGEWFTAIHYAEKGYGVLVEKYMYGNHSRKCAVVSEIFGERGLNLLRKWRRQYHCQPPDLLVFKGNKYFFVEVKRGRDFLRDCQNAYFKNIERVFGCAVVIVDLKILAVKALTIRQPWAELILRGRKPYELRSWKTKYRGPLVIHSAMKVDSDDARQLGLNPEMLTTGCFVGIAVLSDVRPYTGKDAKLLSSKRAGGDWYPNLFSWVLMKPRRISPIEAKGQLGLFKVPKAVEHRIGKRLSVGR